LIFGTLGVVALLGVLNYFCHRAYTVCETTITKGVSRDLRNQIIEKLQILSLQYHVSHESGRFVSKLLVDVERTERFAEMLFNTLLASVITVVFSVAVLATDNWKMLLFYLLCIPFYLLVYRYFNVRFGRLQHAARMANEDLSQSLSQFIQTSFLSKLHGEEEFERKRIDERSVDIIQRQKSIRKTIASFWHYHSDLFASVHHADCRRVRDPGDSRRDADRVVGAVSDLHHPTHQHGYQHHQPVPHHHRVRRIGLFDPRGA